MSANNDSIKKTITVAVLLCLVCSVIVSGAAVSLKPKQVQNKLVDKKKNILAAAGLLQDGMSVEEQFKQVTTRIVNLETGEYATEAELEELAAAGYPKARFDQRKLANDPSFSDKLSKKDDPAGIKRKEDYAAVYLIEKEGQVDRIILPVHGAGLWSTLYGFVALEGNAKTIAGLGFYAHAETPGLGGEVDNPSWKAQWEGKKIHDDQGDVAIDVVKGTVNPSSPNAENQVDGLSGATLTSNGVENLMRYWLGKQGFATYLNKFEQGA
ncbi:Na(+)-translocating NADH-quinone reductase subunit C [Bermanella marisrubri]|uniref:Na(+)-translocating NADH-quinone reductase subunit C n=1 Tax=Bermanella marisrubri TaxID=207949 RepID=Q1N535_9GAMM|nr:Na(+)-translocating NADH-quinone reductase subunit C [Bermanella marisrubri]EAT13243.1 Na(+)-translocating NADH-quinone reductase subunit C [Oceanobacter sp. RED65] [Bermanella marisrubri]QIZ84011.1 Na(+)-translocating NADH-quinone reductase subunit C [Bermanella marisrubri]